MKKLFFMVLSIASLMVSCHKEFAVNDRDVSSGDNERQRIVLGSRIFSATKSSVNDIASWNADGKNIYVYAINRNESVTGDSKLYINNVPASLSAPSTAQGEMKGTLDLKDGDNPFYYGTGTADKYSFYAYYLGYNLESTEVPSFDATAFSVNLADVKVNGDNDIMIAKTVPDDDAIVGGTMVNPNYLYSEYSARHGVVPNLVFNHLLSKFAFNVKYGGHLEGDDKIFLDSLSLDSQVSGTLKISEEYGFEPDGEKQEIKKLYENGMEVGADFATAEDLMVVPAGTDKYVLKVYFRQVFGGSLPNKDFSLTKEISIGDVIVGDDPDSHPSAFEAGKQYVVNITVYGLEAVKVNVELRGWDDAGVVNVDPDHKEDGILKYVKATKGDTEYNLFAKDFKVGEAVYTDFGENKAGAGTYTFDEESKQRESITSIEVGGSGLISNVTSFTAG